MNLRCPMRVLVLPSIQFNFFDHSKLILDQSTSTIVYITPARQHTCVDLNDLARRIPVRALPYL